ncbi:hypothetical protein ABIC94_004308 [Variovorax paradoxus]|uniref:hypothetical protein n=1 Tax=Variovorax paradoxus TaxID=34073 RepID=UPI003396A83F
MRLPFDMTPSAEIAALRAAGIPVDGSGNTKSGYLFVRTTGRVDQRTNIFRWFATGIGEVPSLPVGEAPSMPMRARSEGVPSVF